MDFFQLIHKNLENISYFSVVLGVITFISTRLYDLCKTSFEDRLHKKRTTLLLYRGIKEVSEDYCYAFSKSPWEIYIECIKNDPNFKPFITSNEDIFERAVFDQCKADLYKLEDEVIEHTIKFYSEDKFTRGQLNELHSESFNELSFERKEAFLN